MILYPDNTFAFFDTEREAVDESKKWKKCTILKVLAVKNGSDFKKYLDI